MTDHREARGRQAGGVKSNRNRLIAAVHAAARKAGLDQDAYRDTLERITGKRSAAAMTRAELGRVLDRINGLPEAARPTDRRPHLPKIRALWWDLYWMGAIDQPGADALSAFVARQTGVARIEWLRADQAHRVIEALKDWLTREGVHWPPAGHAHPPEMYVALAVWEKLEALGLVGPGGSHAMARYAQAMRGSDRPMTVRDWNDLTKNLGKRLRRGLGKAVQP